MIVQSTSVLVPEMMDLKLAGGELSCAMTPAATELATLSKVAMNMLIQERRKPHLLSDAQHDLEPADTSD